MKSSFFLFSLLFLVALAYGAEAPTQETHSLMYLADTGIVVLRLSVTVDGQSPRRLQERFVDSLLKGLDKNNDGNVTTDEARGRIPTPREVQQLQLGADAGSVPMDATVDSSPKDGKVTRTELLAYFKRLGMTAFSVQFQPRQQQAQGTPNPLGMNAPSADVPLFDRLDTTTDKKLSKAELAAALEVLKKLDRDDDETISAIELQASVTPQAGATGRQANNPQATVSPFVSLSGGESIQKLIRRIIDKYDSGDSAKSGVSGTTAKNQKLSEKELGLPDGTVDRFDVDGDKQLDFDELRQFVATADPRFELTLDVTGGTVTATGPRKEEVRTTSDKSAHLHLGNVQISLNALPGQAMVDPGLLIRPLFMVSDANANGYLEKSEAAQLTQLGTSFEDLDADRNEKLFPEEVAAYLKTRIDAARSRVVLTINEQGRTLFDILDADRDRRLSHREIRTALDKMSLWDKDGDGLLAESEIPLQFQVTAARGSLPGLLGVPQINPAMVAQGTIPERTAGPVWFRKMDKNRDGEVSRREFLGETEAFSELDLNKDDTIELAEALQVMQ